MEIDLEMVERYRDMDLERERERERKRERERDYIDRYSTISDGSISSTIFNNLSPTQTWSLF